MKALVREREGGPRVCAACERAKAENARHWFGAPGDIRVICTECVGNGWRFTPDGRVRQLTDAQDEAAARLRGRQERRRERGRKLADAGRIG